MHPPRRVPEAPALFFNTWPVNLAVWFAATAPRFYAPPALGPPVFFNTWLANFAAFRWRGPRSFAAPPFLHHGLLRRSAPEPPVFLNTWPVNFAGGGQP